MKVIVIFARLAGIDQLHIGAPKGKMEASSQTVLENLEACMRPLGNLKTIRPICSGGLKATVMWDVAKMLSKTGNEYFQEFIFQAGGGTHAHDLGTFGGARSLVQARDSIKHNVDKFEAMSNHFELLLAFRKWENNVYVEWLKSLNEIPISIKDAIKKWPPLKQDLEKYNPNLLKRIYNL